MPFSREVKERLRNVWYCEVCLRRVKIKQFHSGSGWHLERDNMDGEKRYLVTSAPEVCREMVGRHLSERAAMELGVIENRGSDAYVVCDGCHKGIRNSALEESRQRYPGFGGGVPMPVVQAEITRFMVRRGKHMWYWSRIHKFGNAVLEEQG